MGDTEVKNFNKQLDKLESKAAEELIVDGTQESSASDSATKFNVDPLALMVQDTFNELSKQRSGIEKRWLEDLRQYRGQYAPEVYTRLGKNRSSAFMRITRNKVTTVDSRLKDFLFSAKGDAVFSIRTPERPSLAREVENALYQQHLQATGQEMTGEQFEAKVQEIANTRAKKMQQTIEDQLNEAKFIDRTSAVIHSGDVYGTGILKGPMVSISKKNQYAQHIREDGTKEWKLISKDKFIPYISTTAVWDFYPDMSFTEVQECTRIVERHRMSRSDMIGLLNRPDFNTKAIKNILDQYPTGNYKLQTFENSLFNIGNLDSMLQSSLSTDLSKDRYEVLEYWGYLTADVLEQAGVTIPDKLRSSVELAACIWVCGNSVIKASLAPLEGVKWPYYLYYYDKDETCIFGEGIPSIMRDVQELINSSFRALLDNAAICAGPQLEVNMSLLDESEKIDEVYPFKVWARTGRGAEASSPAIRVFNIDSHSEEFLSMCKLFEEYGDTVTTIPRNAWGEQAQRTSSGMSMMMGSANITIKDQVKRFDSGIIKPFIEAMYHWNMQFNTDNSIKGDYCVVAKGTSTLIAKEVQANSLMQFLNITSNPNDAMVVKRSNIIRELAETLDLDNSNLLNSPEEVASMQQQQAQEQQKERAFMTQMVETAREYGISPKDMIATMQDFYKMEQARAKNETA